MSHRFTRPYVDALFSVASPDAVREMLPPLSAFASTVAANAELNGLFRNPGVPRETKGAVLDGLLRHAKVEGTAARLLHVLLANHRILKVGEVAEAIQERLDRDGNVVEASLDTPVAVTDGDAERLRTALEGRTGRTVRLNRTVDPALLGGFVIRVGSEVYDASLANRLRKTRQALHAGASQEGHHG